MFAFTENTGHSRVDDLGEGGAGDFFGGEGLALEGDGLALGGDGDLRGGEGDFFTGGLGNFLLGGGLGDLGLDLLLPSAMWMHRPATKASSSTANSLADGIIFVKYMRWMGARNSFDAAFNQLTRL